MTTDVELEQVFTAMQDNQTAGMGDIDGSLWASTAAIGMALHMPYGKVLQALSALVRQGRARRHPSGADYWAAMPQGGGGPS